MRPPNANEKGFALTTVIILISALSIVATVVLTTTYNYKLIIREQGNERVGNFYKAQAGVVDGEYRIRANKLDDLGWQNEGAMASPYGPLMVYGFANPNWDPPAYWIDLNTEPITYHTSLTAGDDVRVDIGAVDESGARSIISTGLTNS